MILHLCHLGHRSWCPEGIDTPKSLNLAEKVLVPYMLEAKPCLNGGTSIDLRSVPIDKHRNHKHAVVVAAADD